MASPANGYQALCLPESGTRRFIRVEGIEANANNKYFYVILGDSDANRVGTNTAPSSTAGDGKFILTVGASAGGAGWTWFTFNGNSTTQFTYPFYTVAPLTVRGPTTVCFEISDTVPPQITFWATGYKTDGSPDMTGVVTDASVDCANPATLNRNNAVYRKVDWNNIAALTTGSAYIKSSGTDTTNLAKATKVFVSSNSVLGATETCSTTPASGTTQVCSPSGAQARHFRIEGVQTSAPHTSVTLYAGYAAQPSGGNAPTSNGQARFIFYHGNNPSPPPQTTVNYSNQDGGTISFIGFTSAPVEVCMDITDATPPRITLWATGTNSANCKNRTTLTAANAIFNKNDWTGSFALNNAAAWIYRGSGANATKVTAYTTPLGTGF
ncbi:MAG: hypothetical protein N2Z22_06505 [Turneriella sp.]|nr:hypothetical protein [Turneriella sp.]